MNLKRGIRSEDWSPVQQVFVAASDHPVHQEKQPLSDDVVRRYRGVVVRDTSQSLASLSRGTFGRTNVVSVPTMQQKIEAHMAGIGIGFVPISMAEHQLMSGQLIHLKLENELAAVPTKLAWCTTNRGKAMSWLTKNLLDSIRQ